MGQADFGALTRDALLQLLGGVDPSQATTGAVQQPGAPAPGGYDAPMRVEGPPPLAAPAPAIDPRQPVAMRGTKPPPKSPRPGQVTPSPFFRAQGR